MKITFIMVNPNMSGGDRVCAIYAKKLSELGHTINVLAPSRRSFEVKRRFKWQFKKKYRGSTEEIETKNHFDLMGIKVKYSKDKSPLKNSDIPNADIVIASWWETAEWVNNFSREKGVKVYFIQHHEVHIGQPVERVKQTYFFPFFYKVTIANWLVSLMEKEYASNKPHLVPNSVDHDLFYADMREKQDVPTIGFLFSEAEFKGVKTALNVIQELKKIIPKLKVIAFALKLPEKLNIPDYIELIVDPDQDKIRYIYQQCDLWLCCSLREGFGLTLLEAMACRVPVVATRSGGPQDIITENVNGYLCDVNDVNELTIAAYKILSLSEQEWKNFSTHAYEHTISYTWNTAAKLFEKSLQKILVDDCSSN